MSEMLSLENLARFAKFFLLYFTEISLLFIAVSVLVFLISRKFDARLKSQLGMPKLSSYLKAFALGSLTPFCSCSTIPILNGFLKSGISLGVSSVFLLASPLVNPVVIALLVMSFGLKFSVVYFIIILVCAIGFGMVFVNFDENLFLKSDVRSERRATQNSMAFSLKFTNNLNQNDSNSILKPNVNSVKISSQNIKNFSTIQVQKANICKCKSVKTGSVYTQALRSSLQEYKKIFAYILVAMSIGAAIHGFVPRELIGEYLGDMNASAIIIAAMLGVLLYVRVEALIPIGLSLLDGGASLSAFGAFVISAAGVSLPEIVLLGRFFKGKFIAIFILFIICMAILFASVVRFFG